ncbi:hypothetical protein CNMCM8714_004396 [Aspergillus fumigatus]|nr:hypothetical protein CNMCM8714_004396 [Aspergillus fumigatus]
MIAQPLQSQRHSIRVVAQMGDPLPAPIEGQAYVTVGPINGGLITLPERAFVSPSGDAAVTVPSLSFLITHPGSGSEKSPRHLLFDLGLRATLGDYMKEQQAHLELRRPCLLGPGVAQSLQRSGIDPGKIDTIILSHVHYDHHGDPAHFPNAHFFVGAGSLKLLDEGLGIAASHQFFNPDLFRNVLRVSEFPSPGASPWRALGPFAGALDFLGDGSVYVIDAPGHLPGHINLLCRVGPDTWMYLGGDSCHDSRLLTGERQIATWDDGHGNTGCIHVDQTRAEESLSRIRRLQEMEGHKVEVVMAHDIEVLAPTTWFPSPRRPQCTERPPVSPGRDTFQRFLFTMVPEGRHVRSVYLDSHAGVLTTSVDDKILVDCSTIDTATSMDVGAAVCQNSKTAAFYDAPVSGGSLGAVAGTLTFMVGCVEDDPNLELLQALLRSMGASIFPCGGFLLGLTAKLCNNYCSGLIAIATAEAMNIGIKSGMKPSLLARVFATSTAQSTINDKWNPVPGCLSECPGEQGDLALAVEAADRVGAQLRLGVPALQVYQEGAALVSWSASLDLQVVMRTDDSATSLAFEQTRPFVGASASKFRSARSSTSYTCSLAPSSSFFSKF